MTKAKPWKSPSQRKEYRHAVAILKRKGLISKKIDARSVTRKSFLTKAINENRDVLEGKAKVFKVTKKQAKVLRDAGSRVVKNRVITPHTDTIRGYVRNGEEYTVQRLSKHQSIKTKRLKVSLRDFQLFIEDEENDEKLNKILKEGQQFGFRFYGNQSLRLFPTVQQVREYLMHYYAVEKSVADNDPALMQEIIQNLELAQTIPDKWELSESALRNMYSRDWIDPLHPEKGWLGKQYRPMDRTGRNTGKKYRKARATQREKEAKRKKAERQRLKLIGGEAYQNYLAENRNTVARSRQRRGK